MTPNAHRPEPRQEQPTAASKTKLLRPPGRWHDPLGLMEQASPSQIGQRAQIKLAAYPFQKYGMLSGRVIHISADASESGRAVSQPSGHIDVATERPSSMAIYKARVQLDTQSLMDPQGKKHRLSPGMQAVAEIHQGKRTVMEYLLSPVQKAVAEAGRER